jgi:D-glycero-D-manno-heptose 1,7-bisphosphate phosphatase
MLDLGGIRCHKDTVLVRGAEAVIAAANRRGIPVVLVTNQSGVGRGYYGWGDFAAVQQAISSQLAVQGAWLDAVYACAHHPTATGVFCHPDHPARKPNPGMILRAAAALDLELGKSWLIGDRAIDIEAAKRAGLAGAMLVTTGYGENDRLKAKDLAAANFMVRFGASIADAPTLPIFRTEPS